MCVVSGLLHRLGKHNSAYYSTDLSISVSRLACHSRLVVRSSILQLDLQEKIQEKCLKVTIFLLNRKCIICSEKPMLLY